MDAAERGKYIDLYRSMVTIRKFELMVERLHLEGILPGLKHLYVGEEAVAVGVCAALEADDYLVSTHRGHGHLIAKGAEVHKIMAELYGKKTGYSKGKGGSMHIADIERGILGTNGIVSGGIPIAGGAALSAKMRGTTQITVCFFGDGGANEGIFHESLNIAGAWKLPILFICENNQYAISTAQERVSAVTCMAERAASYGMPGVVVDGMNVLAVREASWEAAARAREGAGPTLIECNTYRLIGHYAGEGSRGDSYRSGSEFEKWKTRCPIRQFRELLLSQAGVPASELEGLEQSVEGLIDEAVEFAAKSPYPEPRDALEDLFLAKGAR